MIGLSSRHQYYFYTNHADMRKGFDGLSGLVINELGRDPLDGSVYIFINRRRDRMKLLVWEQGGFWLYYKRLERGSFELPELSIKNRDLRLNWEDLMLMISGIKVSKIRRKKRYKIA